MRLGIGIARFRALRLRRPRRRRSPRATPCPNPNALGLARTVEVDTTGGPGFGFEQYKEYDFLVLKEVVLTFDDGPWPVNTRAVLDALAAAVRQGDVLPHRQACAVAPGDPQGGGRRRPHDRRAHLVARQPQRGRGKAKGDKTADAKTKAIEEIEKGFSAVKLRARRGAAPFFRFPYLQDPKEAVQYLGSPQHRRLLARSRQLRLQDPQARGRREVGDDQAGAEGQGHHPDARLPGR